jgi:mannose-6-phosphate isomerase-like protein (cupin superfamily)
MLKFTAPFAVQPGVGPVLETPTDDLITVKADTRGTNGSLTILELVVAPQSGPALHIHVREDEVWWVLEGDFRFKAGDTMLRTSTGGMVFGPRGVPHSFQNIGDTPGRLLIVTSPSGVERFFEQFAALPRPVDGDGLAAVGHANWIEFIGPPLGISDPL